MQLVGSLTQELLELFGLVWLGRRVPSQPHLPDNNRLLIFEERRQLVYLKTAKFEKENEQIRD
jgi:hypothetical protein